MLQDDELDAMEARCRAASAGPWKAYVEGRDHLGGDDFIRVGGLSDDEPDMYVTRAEAGPIIKPASADDLYFIAGARQDVPALLAEVRRLRAAAG